MIELILKNKSKIINSSLFLGIIILLIANFTVAMTISTDPEEVVVGYTEEAHSAWVDITHPTDNIDTHYVNRIQVILNGDTIFDESYISQPAVDYFGIMVENVYAVDGDVLEARVTCNWGGETYASTTIGETTSLDVAPIGLVIFALITTVSLVAIVKRKGN